MQAVVLSEANGPVNLMGDGPAKPCCAVCADFGRCNFKRRIAHVPRGRRRFDGNGNSGGFFGKRCKRLLHRLLLGERLAELHAHIGVFDG